MTVTYMGRFIGLRVTIRAGAHDHVSATCSSAEKVSEQTDVSYLALVVYISYKAQRRAIKNAPV